MSLPERAKIGRLVGGGGGGGPTSWKQPSVHGLKLSRGPSAHLGWRTSRRSRGGGSAYPPDQHTVASPGPKETNPGLRNTIHDRPELPAVLLRKSPDPGVGGGGQCITERS